ncbi:MAG TPA: diguanylate cyclase [Nitrospiraceae bacterium]|nr:diguanylate cyclase [Nitrospiraceae bacterium]
MRHEFFPDGIPSTAPVQQNPSVSVEEIDHGIQALRQLIDRLETIKKETECFTVGHTKDLRLPHEAIRFHARKEMVQVERQIREAIGDIFGRQSVEFRKHQHLRINLGSNAGIPDAVRAVRSLMFCLQEKRLHLMRGRPQQGDYTPDIDPLTDLYTRRLLNRYFAHELDRSKRHGYTLALVYFALPDWQKAAALYGSTAWEEIIVSFACACKVILRGYDYGARMTEHEFALLLPQTETQGAHIAIKRIAEQFDGAVKRFMPDLKITLEFGTATFPFDGEALSSLFEVATAHRMCFTDDLKEVRMLSRSSM